MSTKKEKELKKRAQLEETLETAVEDIKYLLAVYRATREKLNKFSKQMVLLQYELRNHNMEMQYKFTNLSQQFLNVLSDVGNMKGQLMTYELKNKLQEVDQVNGSDSQESEEMDSQKGEEEPLLKKALVRSDDYSYSQDSSGSNSPSSPDSSDHSIGVEEVVVDAFHSSQLLPPDLPDLPQEPEETVPEGFAEVEELELEVIRIRLADKTETEPVNDPEEAADEGDEDETTASKGQEEKKETDGSSYQPDQLIDDIMTELHNLPEITDLLELISKSVQYDGTKDDISSIFTSEPYLPYEFSSVVQTYPQSPNLSELVSLPTIPLVPLSICSTAEQVEKSTEQSVEQSEVFVSNSVYEIPSTVKPKFFYLDDESSSSSSSGSYEEPNGNNYTMTKFSDDAIPSTEPAEQVEQPILIPYLSQIETRQECETRELLQQHEETQQELETSELRQQTEPQSDEELQVKLMERFVRKFTIKYVVKEADSYILMKDLIQMANRVRPGQIPIFTSKEVFKQFTNLGPWKKTGMNYACKGYRLQVDKTKQKSS